MKRKALKGATKSYPLICVAFPGREICGASFNSLVRVAKKNRRSFVFFTSRSAPCSHYQTLFNSFRINNG